MTLRTDHVAGGFFLAFGVLVLAISGNLPVGSLSSPGSGFLPKILAVLTILFGLTLVLRAGESKPFATLAWDDLKHAALVVLLTAAAVLLFERLGFLTTEVLLIFALLVVIERRSVLAAAIYSVAVVGVTYLLFAYALKTPLETGPFGF
jgi:Tripartite tricarboxylate transporter TctB family